MSDPVPDAAEVIAARLHERMGYHRPPPPNVIHAVRALLYENIITVGDRLWVEVPYGMGLAKPQP